MKLRLTRRARSDIEQIVEYLHARSPSGARNVLASVIRTLDAIGAMPEASQRTDRPNVRVRIVTRYGYKIFFSISGDSIDILHVRHSRRMPWSRTQ